jgi:NDP-sugar pyrophosphorylase family protein
LADPRCDCIILCGGRGCRLHAHTLDRVAKPLVRVGGRHLIEYCLDLVDASFAEHLIFAVDHHDDQIRRWLAGSAPAIPTIVSKQEHSGMLEAIRRAANLSTMPSLMCLHADEIKPGLDLNTALRFHVAKRSLATVVATPSTRLTQHCIVRFEHDSDLVTGFTIRPRGVLPEERDLVLAGALILERAVFHHLAELAGTADYFDIVQPLVDARLLRVFVSPSEVYFNVGTPEELEAAVRYFEHRGGPAAP